MALDGKKTKDTAPTTHPVAESKSADAATKTEGAKAEGVKVDGVKAEGAKAEAAKSEVAPKKQGMGEGQKPVTQAYKDNWNAIFGEKKKKR